MIETLKPAPRVIMRVVPPLLSDVLRILLEERRLEVSSCPTVERRAHPREPRRFALAIVTAGLPVDLRADRVIVVDDDGVPTVEDRHGVVPTSGGDGNLSALLALIDDLLP